MVIGQIHITGLFTVEAKYDAPVARDIDCPKVLQVAFHRVQPQAYQIHIRRMTRRIKPGQYCPYTPELVLANPLGPIPRVKVTQSFVPERSDHVIL